MRLPLRSAVAALAACGLVLAAGGTAASADDPQLHVVRKLPGAYAAPLQLAVSGPRVYVADSGASALFRSGKKRPIARGPAPSRNPERTGDLAGVAVAHGRIAYTTTEADHRNTHLTVLHHGQQELRVNLGAYERHANPDGGVTYGATDPAAVTKACAAQLKRIHQPAVYTGIEDSHPYAVTAASDGGWLVADAAGNDVLHVTGQGAISTVAVLPAQPVLLTPAVAKQAELPACAGLTVRFEPVPTDVELGPRGIYVSTLPGGVGGTGSVYLIPSGSSTPQLVATGFAEAVNLAVTPEGRIYVVELGAGISEVEGTGGHRVIALPGVASVEWADGALYASTAPAVLGGKAPGRVVVLG